jgi:hypothetical protein
MSKHLVILHSRHDRERAARAIAAAPAGSVVEVRAPRRTLDQNSMLWSILSQISMAKPQGRHHTPEVWKCLAMHACGHAVQFEPGLDGSPFPIGFRSSKLTKAQMSDLLEFLIAYAAEQGVVLTIPEDKRMAA